MRDGETKNSAIAIIGMALNVPGAENLEEFWENLRNGRESFGPLTDEELNELGLDHTARQNPDWLVVRGFPKNPKDFDAAYFGIPPNDATLMDPQQRHLLECAQNAFDDAGYDPLAYDGDIGVWAGAGTSGYYSEFLEPAFRDSPQQQFASIILNDFHFPATRLAHTLNLTGPAMNVATACSTGLVAVHYACQALRAHECDMALVGVSRINPGAYSGYPRMEGMIYSSDGHCRVFDSRADGTVFTNGTGTVLLKRLDRALADRDNIRGVILGSAVNNDGNVKLSFTAPSIDGQEAVLEEAYRAAGVDPATVSFIEGHGTATLLGDPIEVHALTRVFRRRTEEQGICRLGSVKSNIGHLEVAAGVVGLIKAVMAIEKQEIPATIHFERANPALELASSPFVVNDQLEPWLSELPRRAGVSSFGIGGTNAHLVLEEMPRQRTAPSRRQRHLLPVSARTAHSRDAMLAALERRLTGSDLNMADVAFTLQSGRRSHPMRAVFSATTCGSAAARLRDGVVGAERPVKTEALSLWMFPGQGSQYVGMARGLYEEEATFRAVFDQCANRLLPLIGVDLRSVVFDVQASADVLNQTRITQPALFTVEYAMARQLQAWGVEPVAMIGHSIGEYVAACLAGVFALDDALDLVAARGQLMQSLPAGSMLAVNAPADSVAGYLSATVCLAAVNSPEHCVLSGPLEEIENVRVALEAAGVPARRLQTSHAFHSTMMEPILAQFAERVAAVPRQVPQIPFVSNVTGSWIDDEDALDPAYWSRHLRQAVLFADGLETLCAAYPADVLVEVGPGTTLSQLAGLHRCAQEQERIALGRHPRDQRPDGQVFLESVGQLWVSGVELDWNSFYDEEARHRVSLPAYVFDRDEFFFREASQNGNGRRYDFHPLLGQRHKSALSHPEIQFDATISTWSPEFLLQHTIFGTPLVPGACYVEIALTVGKQMLGTDHVMVSDIVFQKAIPLPRNTECQLQTVVVPESDGSLRMRLFSLPLTEGDSEGRPADWEEHVSAVIRAAPSTEVADASAELHAWRARLTTPVPHSELYDPQRIGFQWGPAFQSVKQAYVGEWEILGRLELPTFLDWEFADFFFHPSLLDGCFQLVGRAVPPDVLPGLILPTAAERIVVHGPVPKQFWCHITGRPEECSKQGITLDLRMVGDDGREFARIDRFLELASSQSTLVEAGARVNSWYHQIAWRALDRAALGEAADAFQLVLFADRGGVAEAVARQALAARLPAPILVYRDSVPASAPETCPSFAFTPEALAQHLGRLHTPVSCVALWALDQQDDGAVGACAELTTLVQAWIAPELPCQKFVVVTRGAQQIAEEAVTGLDQAAVWGLQRVVINEHPDLGAALLDLAPGDDLERNAAVVLDFASRLRTREDQVCQRGDALYAARLIRLERQQGAARGPFSIKLAGYGSLDGLDIETIRPRHARRNEITIAVEASAVNFRDVLQLMGAMREFNEAAGLHDPAIVPIGFECAGRVIEVGEHVQEFAVGDRVLAFGHHCHTSHFTADVGQFVHIPDQLDAADAAALPTVLVTALYGLQHLAKLKAGDKVLIHSCAGGVGQAALRVARDAGAIVYATASPAKWDGLLQQGVRQVWSSRDHAFAEGIMAATGGGVDVVLNALSGEFVDKSLAVLAQGGRFVEIGKVGAWSPQRMAQTRPDVSYFKFDLNEINPALFKSILEQGIALVGSGVLTPLPVRKFPVAEAKAAFRWLAQGQNVGKAVLEMPDHSELTTIRADRSYLITGGLGGLGMVMAQGLAENGARHLALVGRREPGEQAHAAIEELRRQGVAVHVLRGDISVRSDAQALFDELDASMPPLAGVLHAAGVLDDGVVVKLDRDRLRTAMAPKVAGALHLDELTSSRELDFFVMFSSISATLGAAGQGNYSAGNAFMDVLAAQRRARGLPALSVGWGAWAASGMAAELVDRFRSQRASVGLKDIAPSEGIIAMTTLLDRGVGGHVVAMPVQWSKYLAQFMRGKGIPPLFTELAAALQLESAGNQSSAQQENVSFITEVRGADTATRKRLLTGLLTKLIFSTVGNEAGAAGEGATLVELGVDSLIAMELRTRIARSVGIQLPLSSVVGTVTVSEVADSLLAAFAAEYPAVEAAHA